MSLIHTVTIYRRDSETPVVYERVKHFWWEESARLVVSQLRDVDKPEHDYWIWPVDLISHVLPEPDSAYLGTDKWECSHEVCAEIRALLSPAAATEGGGGA